MSLKYANLDFYDDNGLLLKEIFPEQMDLPTMVKTAHVMEGREDSDLYALCIEDNSSVHKKFPIIDAGNTWLSSLYFAKNMEKLSHEAKVTAATNLKEACLAFDVPIVDVIEKYAHEQVPTNIVTDTTPEPIYTEPVEVDAYAITSEGRQQYPLHNIAAVRAADSYFTEHHRKFAGSDRREYAVKVASIAEKFDIPVGVEIEAYSTDAEWDVIGDHMATRYSILKEIEAPAGVRQGFVKISSVMQEMAHDDAAEILEEFDVMSGLDKFWGKGLLDPYQTFFNLEKVAMGMAREPATIQIGNDIVTEDALNNLSKNVTKVKEQFGESFAMEFSKQPLAVFKSLPTPHKKILARLAEDSIGAY